MKIERKKKTSGDRVVIHVYFEELKKTLCDRALGGK